MTSRSLAPFARDSFDGIDVGEREYLCETLAVELTHRLHAGKNFHADVRKIVEELRAEGHQLWSYDESDDFEVWGPDYSKPGRPGIIVTFSLPANVVVKWTEA